MVRNAFLKRVESALETLEAEVDRIAERAGKAGENARIRYEEEIAALRLTQEAARRKIRGVREAGAASWGPLKSGAEDAVADLKKAIDAAIARLKKSA